MKVYKHGSQFNEEDQLQQLYPFRLCPECMSQSTIVDTSPHNWATTGEYHYINKGIFDKKFIYVNYLCKDCGCIFTDEIEEKDEKSIIQVGSDLAGFIIFTLITILSTFSLICSLIVFSEISIGWHFLWVIISLFIFLIATMSCVVFYESL